MESYTNRRGEYGRGTGIPHPIDLHVGKRIRLRRLFLGMNQETLAEHLGLTFQQVQKYEAGANRVSASRLADMARILDVSIAHFFADLSPDQEPSSRREQRERMEQPETIAFLRFYYGIFDEEVRKHFLALIKAMAAQEANPGKT